AALVLSELRPSERERWLEEGRRLLDFASRDLNPTSRQRLRQVPAFERAFSVAGPEGRELEGWRVQRWRRFAAATRDVISAGDAELAMTRLLEGSLALLDGERASWIEREAGALVLRAAAGAVVGEEAFSRSIVQRALDTRACVTAANAMEEGDFGGASVHALSLRSVLAVPVGEGEAVLYLEDRLRPAAYDERDGALLEAFADLGSLVLAARRREGRTVAERLRAQELRQRAEALAAEQASELRQRRSEMIADSPAMKRVLELSARVATSDAAALITGESGSGKGELARHIHALSERASGPLLAQNCAVIPEGLIESVLFGHVRGAFTGADEDRAGLFEAASGGTLFLDEIAEASPALQGALLRVVQEGRVRRVGDSQDRSVDVRILSATNASLERAVREGRFRQDLFFRLAVLQLEVPSLRDRPEDLRALVARWSRRRRRVLPDAVEALLRHSWPGNVRELLSELERASLFADDAIGARHLSPAIRDARPGDLKAKVAALETQLIRQALARSGGNITRAAKELGLSRYGLQKMMTRLGLRRAEADA
ncbi:MAG: sigma 54-interacting transcriptional regulator, partial [Myxococcota bacterium]